MPRSIEIVGLRDAVESLRELGPRNAKRIVRKGLRAGGRLIRDSERGDAPKRTGKLLTSIRVSGAKAAPGTVAIVAAPSTKAFGGKPFYPAFVIYGHRVRGSSGRTVAPNDFVSRAFERSSEAAADAAARMILEELTRNF